MKLKLYTSIIYNSNLITYFLKTQSVNYTDYSVDSRLLAIFNYWFTVLLSLGILIYTHYQIEKSVILKIYVFQFWAIFGSRSPLTIVT